MKTSVVIGPSRFGSVVATELSSLGREALAVDEREDHVQRVAEKIAYAVTGDARGPSVLRTLGVHNHDCVMVAVGDSIGSSVLITFSLKEIGVGQVIYKVQSHIRHKVLEKIGADQMMFPEHEMEVKLAQGLSSSDMLNFIELSKDFGTVETAAFKKWYYEMIQNLDVRARYKVDIIAVRRDKSGALNVAPGASYVIELGDVVAALGRTEDINHLQDL